MINPYEFEDFITDRTQADVDEVKRLKKFIAEEGFNNLPYVDKIKWEHGLKACLNYNDLKRLVWATAELGEEWRYYREELIDIIDEYGIDINDYRQLFDTRIKSHDFYNWGSVSITLSPFPYLSEGEYTYKDLSDDIKSACYIQGYECINFNSDLTVFENLSYNELNKIEYYLQYSVLGAYRYWQYKFENLANSTSYTGDEVYAE